MPSTPLDTTFTQSTQALDDILSQFRAGNLPLEDALALYEQGVAHITRCQSLLTSAQGQFTVLTETLAQSQAAASAFTSQVSAEIETEDD